MRSNLMAVLGVGMFLCVVFLVTFVDLNTASPPKDSAKSDSGAAVVGVPLSFTSTEMGFDPTSDDLDKKYFAGFYEVTDQLHPVNFWFKNPHPQPVLFTVRGRSCSACTSANVAVVNAEAMKRFESATAVARFGLGVAPVPDLVTPLAHIALLNSLQWQPLNFETPDAGVSIPAAADADTPTWGVFQVLVKVTALGPKRLAAEVGMSIGTAPGVRQVFGVTVIGAAGLEVAPKKIDFGDFPDGAAPRVAELLCWSATRDQDELPPPSASVNTPDAFLRLGTPVPLTAADRNRIGAEKLGGPLRIKGGYAIPVTLSRKVPPAEVAPGAATQPDVGPYERQIGVAGSGSTVLAVNVTANVTGILALRDGGVIDLKDFNGRDGTERNVVVVSDRADLTLELVPEECLPKFVKVALGTPSDVAGRREWAIKLVVPPGACQADLPPDGAVVLRGVTGGEAVKIRLPMKGRGFVRSRAGG